MTFETLSPHPAYLPACAPGATPTEPGVASSSIAVAGADAPAIPLGQASWAAAALPSGAA